MRGEKQTYKCLTCKLPFTARTADRKRGWARYCSKSCKAIKQTQRTGYSGPRGDGNIDHEGPGWDAHKGEW